MLPQTLLYIFHEIEIQTCLLCANNSKYQHVISGLFSSSTTYLVLETLKYVWYICLNSLEYFLECVIIFKSFKTETVEMDLYGICKTALQFFKKKSTAVSYCVYTTTSYGVRWFLLRQQYDHNLQ